MLLRASLEKKRLPKHPQELTLIPPFESHVRATGQHTNAGEITLATRKPFDLRSANT